MTGDEYREEARFVQTFTQRAAGLIRTDARNEQVQAEARRLLEREVMQQAQAKKVELVDDFLGNLVGQLRGLVYNAILGRPTALVPHPAKVAPASLARAGGSLRWHWHLSPSGQAKLARSSWLDSSFAEGVGSLHVALLPSSLADRSLSWQFRTNLG